MNFVAAATARTVEPVPGAPAHDPPARGRVSVRDLTVAYPGGSGEPAVAGFNLEIEPGAFVCLLGPSGCGKSTVLNVIAGLIRPAGGQVLVDGAVVDKPGAERGMVFQQPTLLPWKTVLDNVALGPLLNGCSGNEAESTARSFLEMVGLHGYEKHYPSQLSGGMQQRVGIIRALANYPRVLLMDEPFSALDAQTRATMQEALLGIWAEFRTTVVFVTHDIDEAIFLGDCVVVMSSGPGRILEAMPVRLPRPRQAQMQFDPGFIEVKRRCFELIRAEGLKSLRGRMVVPAPSKP